MTKKKSATPSAVQTEEEILDKIIVEFSGHYGVTQSWTESGVDYFVIRDLHTANKASLPFTFDTKELALRFIKEELITPTMTQRP